MTNQAHTQLNTAKTLAFTPVQVGLLQRKRAACGKHAVAGGECAESAKKKNGLQRMIAMAASNGRLERAADRIADQVMATPAHPAVSGARPHIQPYLGAAVQSELSRLLRAQGFPSALKQPMTIGHINAGEFRIGEGTGAYSVCAHTAHKIFRGMGR